MQRSEVDPTGSLWYMYFIYNHSAEPVLKLTLPGRYGIESEPRRLVGTGSEVDPTGSLWYKSQTLSCVENFVLKLTLPGHYGISPASPPHPSAPF